jgi:hypothetical protein
MVSFKFFDHQSLFKFVKVRLEEAEAASYLAEETLIHRIIFSCIRECRTKDCC